MKRNRTILIVDDEEKIVNVLRAYLEKEGYQVLSAYDGTTAMELFKSNDLTLILLDLMLPDIMGEQICQMIRMSSRVPIVMLTAKTEEADLIKGLQMGADDYIFKPFSPRTIVAKIEAILRRIESDELTSIPVSYNQGSLVIDFQNAEVKVFGRDAGLTPTEYKILTTMAKAPNWIFTREQLITYALGDDFDGYDRSIDTYIKSIRTKIEEDRKKPVFILTVHGMGYKFTGTES
ncbi:response regulator transcription factor [Lacrimispora sp.]|uniref:response regulator transcription factor n=1 Tax=Lacrimispora sp. TaxID=2719234 RepID=UPI00289C8D84|nr:response regulator transcription factor [Lacrimispora sp.]